MSCLCADELPMDVRAAAQLALNARVEQRFASLSVSWPSPRPTGTSLPVAQGAPCTNTQGDGHISLSHAEVPAMVEKQVTNHPPLQVCYPGHRPYMYERNGDRKVQFYVECSQCMVRGVRCDTADEAARAWGLRMVGPIRGTADHSAVAA